jgi:hypothetical protein
VINLISGAVMKELDPRFTRAARALEAAPAGSGSALAAADGASGGAVASPARAGVDPASALSRADAIHLAGVGEAEEDDSNSSVAAARAAASAADASRTG